MSSQPEPEKARECNYCGDNHTEGAKGMCLNCTGLTHLERNQLYFMRDIANSLITVCERLEEINESLGRFPKD